MASNNSEVPIRLGSDRGQQDESSNSIQGNTHLSAHNNSGIQADKISSRKRPSEEPHEGRKKEFTSTRSLSNKYRIELDDMIKDAIGVFREAKSYFRATQIGLTIWTAREKEQLFINLSRYGRHNIPLLASNLQEKSEAEIQVYVNTLEECSNKYKAQRSKYMAVQEQLHDDIPTALEITEGCIQRLEHVAKLVCTNAYTYEVLEHAEYFGKYALLTRPLAYDLDLLLKKEEQLMINQQRSTQSLQQRDQNQAVDAFEIPREDANVGMDPEQRQNIDAEQDMDSIEPFNYPGLQLPTNQSLLEALRFLDLDSFLSLSQVIFMNKGPPHEEENWMKISDHKDEYYGFRDAIPFMFAGAFVDFYRIAKCLTKRLVSAAFFQALSRARATDSTGNAEDGPRRRKVLHKDVITAIDMLNLKRGSQRHNFWITKAREYSLRVFDVEEKYAKLMASRLFSAEDRGFRPLSYSEVERRLRTRNDTDYYEAKRDPKIVNPTSTRDPTIALPSQQVAVTLSEQGETSLNTLGALASTTHQDFEEESIEDMNVDNGESTTHNGSRLEDIPHNEQAQLDACARIDAYLEEYDQHLSAQEEKVLWGWGPGGLTPDIVAHLDAQKPPPAERPRTGVNPSLTDCHENFVATKVDFREEWERYGRLLPENAFRESKREWLKRKEERLNELARLDGSSPSEPALPALSVHVDTIDEDVDGEDENEDIRDSEDDSEDENNMAATETLEVDSGDSDDSEESSEGEDDEDEEEADESEDERENAEEIYEFEDEDEEINDEDAGEDEAREISGDDDEQGEEEDESEVE